MIERIGGVLCFPLLTFHHPVNHIMERFSLLFPTTISLTLSPYFFGVFLAIASCLCSTHPIERTERASGGRGATCLEMEFFDVYIGSRKTQGNGKKNAGIFYSHQMTLLVSP